MTPDPTPLTITMHIVTDRGVLTFWPNGCITYTDGKRPA